MCLIYVGACVCMRVCMFVYWCIVARVCICCIDVGAYVCMCLCMCVCVAAVLIVFECVLLLLVHV